MRKQSRKILTEKRRLPRYRGLPYSKYAAPLCLASVAFQRFCDAAQFLRDLCFLMSLARRNLLFLITGIEYPRCVEKV